MHTPIQVDLTYAIRDPSGAPPSTITVGEGGQGRRRTGPEEQRQVAIRDARSLRGELSLDLHGFRLVDHPVHGDLWDAAYRAQDYDRSIERLVKQETGAARVVVFDHTLRSEAPDRQQGTHARGPVQLVHNDYTPWSAEQRVRDVLAAEAEALLAHRYAIVQVWQPIGRPVARSPLAICDARTLAAADRITARRVHPTRVGETFHITYNPDHRWFWFPELQPHEALVFKTFDSAEDGRARFTAHTAFELPGQAADAPARESIEARTLAFFAP